MCASNPQPVFRGRNAAYLTFEARLDKALGMVDPENDGDDPFGE
jgi:hypothetical protein